MKFTDDMLRAMIDGQVHSGQLAYTAPPSAAELWWTVDPETARAMAAELLERRAAWRAGRALLESEILREADPAPAKPMQVTEAAKEAGGRALAKTLMLSWDGLPERVDGYPAWQVRVAHNPSQHAFREAAGSIIEAALQHLAPAQAKVTADEQKREVVMMREPEVFLVPSLPTTAEKNDG